ncbi:hypothetical protein LEP1GSC188_1688 [Leptospira weilii serovar Topaz str. LT2116]|uniref:Universal stress family protein n=1 Tax=Leptospira weilii serovar Topaz str. LT2116 TaxID=1088540 RepID=M3H0R2_9LEPT|nr:hypothetical protein LEP1GSC188_1688 [Leptospira weilii serovar Topaz str. LT2116]
MAISASPNSYSLLRYAKRLAYERNGELFAIYNQTRENLSKENISQLEKNLNFARELGSEILYAADENPVYAILRIAEQKNITRVVLEKPPMSWRKKWNSPSSKLARITSNFELCLVPYDHTSFSGEESALGRFLKTSSGGKQYVASLSLILLATCISLFLEPLTGYWSISFLYLFSYRESDPSSPKDRPSWRVCYRESFGIFYSFPPDIPSLSKNWKTF